MKTVNAFALVAAGLVSSVSAFSLDFSSIALGTQLNPDLVINVPGYGDVRFTEASGSDLEIGTGSLGPIILQGITMENGEGITVTFEGAPATDISFGFIGVGGDLDRFDAGSFIGNSAQLLSFDGTEGTLVSVNFNSVPEPSSTLLIALSALGLIGRRRR